MNSWTIGEKREQSSPITLGPGHYQHEIGDSQTKNRAPRALIQPEGSPERENITLGPGAYEEHNTLVKNMNSWTIGEKREQTSPITLGPGHYQHEQADGQVMNTAPRPFISPVKEGTPQQPSIGPGHYDEHNTLVNNLTSWTIGEKREQTEPVTLGPGQYQHELGDSQIKNRAPRALINPEGSPIRENITLGPGAYEEHNTLVNNMTSWTIGEKREQSSPVTLGPGQYQHELGDTQIKNRAPAALINPEGSPARENITLGPGAYEEHNTLVRNMNSWTIGEKREQSSPITLGPGHYQHEQADGIVKNSAPRPFISPVKEGAPQQPTLGPGHYDEHNTLVNNLTSWTIGEKREQSSPVTLGPGQYQHELGDTQIKNRAPRALINPEGSPVRQNVTLGPGAYEENNTLVRNMNSWTIGEKREQSSPITLGPGHYQNEHGDSQTKNRAPRALIYPEGSPTRQNVTLGPGAYEESNNLVNKMNSWTIGEKREQSQAVTLGPGQYEHQLGDTQVKNRAPRFLINPEGSPQRQNVTLGPGAYEENNTLTNNMTAWTIGQKREQSSPVTLGPGQYQHEQGDHQIKPRAPGATINPVGSPVRNEQTVGPGQYEECNNLTSKMNAWTIGEKREQTKSVTLGPGAYQHQKADGQVKPRAPGHSISPTRKQVVHQPTMGPGAYEESNNFVDKTGGWTIAEKRSQIKEVTLGPGQYQHETGDHQVKPRAPGATINPVGSPIRNEKTVGPGQYEEVQRFGKSGGFTIGTKYEQKIDPTLGPGHYSEIKSNVVKTRTKSTLISPSKAPSQVIERDIGPGTYKNLKSVFDKNDRPFTIGKRKYLNVARSPGPGQYEHQKGENMTRTRSQSVLIRGKARELQQSATMGPGAYEQSDGFGKNVNGVTTYQKPRKEVKQISSPAPGSYQIEKSNGLTRVSNNGGSFSKSNRNSQKSSTQLGPGYYNSVLSLTSPQSQGFLFNKEKKQKQVTSAIGPGTYDRNEELLRTRSPSAKIERTERFTSLNRSASALGPGSYNLKQGENGRMHTIGEKRGSKIEKTIGPGHYEVAQAIVKTKTRIPQAQIMRTSRQTATVKSNIGPGTYDFAKYITNARNSKGYTISESKSGVKINRNGGPGTYDVEKATGATRQRSRSAKFDQNARFNQTQSSGVGPGYYEERNNLLNSLGSMTISQKQPSKAVCRTPAPGQYDHKLSVTKNKSTAAIISPSRQKPKQVDSNGGPGSYDIIHNNNGQGFTIAEKREQLGMINNPAPGQYHQSDSLTKTRTIGHSFSQQQNLQEQASSIGPGAYDPQERSPTGYTFTREQQSKMMNSNAVGPGYYEVDERAVRATSPQFKMSSPAPPKALKRNEPGPGYYNSPQKAIDVNKSHSFSKSKKTSAVKGATSKRLGPGAYLSGYTQTQSRVKLGHFNQQKNRQSESTSQLGPGSYAVIDKFGSHAQAHTISRQERPQTAKERANLGPGSYTIEQSDSQTRTRQPSTVFQTVMRSADLTESSQVGPGSYNVERNEQSPSFSIQPRHAEQIREQSPAPGQYNPEVSQTKSRAQANTFSKTTNLQKSSSSPSPVTYDQKRFYNYGEHGPEHAIAPAQKRQAKGQTSPGPGTYEYPNTFNKKK